MRKNTYTIHCLITNDKEGSWNEPDIRQKPYYEYDIRLDTPAEDDLVLEGSGQKVIVNSNIHKARAKGGGDKTVCVYSYLEPWV